MLFDIVLLTSSLFLPLSTRRAIKTQATQVATLSQATPPATATISTLALET